MSLNNELESDRAMVMNLESFGVDGVGYDHDDVHRDNDETETDSEAPIPTNPQ